MFRSSTEIHTNEPSFGNSIFSHPFAGIKGTKLDSAPSSWHYHFIGSGSRKTNNQVADLQKDTETCVTTHEYPWELFFETEAALFALENRISDVYTWRGSYENHELGKTLKSKELDKLEKELESLRHEVSGIKVHSEMAPTFRELKSLKQTIGSVSVASTIGEYINFIEKALEAFCSLQNNVHLVSGSPRDFFSSSLTASQLLDEVECIQDKIADELESFADEIAKLSRLSELLSAKKLSCS